MKNKGFLSETVSDFYSAHCKPQYIKNKKREEQNDDNINLNYELCPYEPYIRIHHSDLRDITDNFIIYINHIWQIWESNDLTYLEYFTNIYSSNYDKKKLLEMHISSKFINKIKKQIDNISNNRNMNYIQQF